MNKKIIFILCIINVLILTAFLFLACTFYKLLSKTEWKEIGGTGEGANVDIIPVGTIVAFFGTSDKIPDGWLICDGSSIPSSNIYDNLRTLLYPASIVPDLRGMFLRGMQGTRSDASGDLDAAGRIGGNTIGSYQDDAFQNHWHRTYSYLHGYTSGTNSNIHWQDDTYTPSVVNDPIPTNKGITIKTSDYETRPKNVYVNYIIKY